MCLKPWIAVAAGLEWRVTPFDTEERILRYAQNRGVDYALLLPWQLGANQRPDETEPYFEREMDIVPEYRLFDFNRAPSDE
jgi:hypothetical protein